MTPKQTVQFNRMRAVLLLIARGYMTVGQIRRNAEKFYGLSFEESLIVAYEHMKTEAAAAVRGVSEIRPNTTNQRADQETGHGK